MCDNEPRTAPHRAHAPHEGRGPHVMNRVLIVDDDPALAEMLGIVLRGEGYHVTHCGDGTSALATFRDAKPDLVLLDVMLPGKNGVEVCRAIRAESDVPIVMLTARTDTLDVVAGLEAGNLDERMPVRGEDDIARLATSFNAMASSLQRQIGQLEDLSHLQQRFTSDVSHELRTPLTTIRMAADMIHDSRGDFAAHVARSSELLSKELDRFESLLADLLEISRFDAGGAVLSRTPTSMRQLCAEVNDMHAQLADKLGCRLVLDAPNDVTIDVDRRRVERILRNLVANAIEHGQGQPVVVTLRANSTAVSVSVRDYGIGLKEGEADKVFDRFWRADPARARTTGGTGLGLSISLEDARLHDGFLEAWGAPGEGSCFRLTLPRVQGVAIAASPGPLQPGLSARTKQISSGTMRTSDGGARLASGYPVAIDAKKRSNALPQVIDGEGAVDAGEAPR